MVRQPSYRLLSYLLSYPGGGGVFHSPPGSASLVGRVRRADGRQGRVADFQCD